MKFLIQLKIAEYFLRSKLTSLFDLAEAKINLSGLTKIAFELIFLKYSDTLLKFFAFNKDQFFEILGFISEDKIIIPFFEK